MKSNRKLKVGLIGCGVIGFEIAKSVTSDFKHAATLAYVCDHHQENLARLKKKTKTKAKIVMEAELIRSSDLIIEAASPDVSKVIIPKILKAHKQALILSVGGVLKVPGLRKLLSQSHGKIWIPSGAIAGIDGVLAAAEAGLQSVKLITRKPPRGLQEAPYFEQRKFPSLRAKEEKCVFRGSVAQAIIGFPQNVNVAALLALAGLGPRLTRVEVWTSKKYKRNQHEVSVKAKSGTIDCVITNVPSPVNPKTSALAFHGAIATLRKIFSTCHVGT